MKISILYFYRIQAEYSEKLWYVLFVCFILLFSFSDLIAQNEKTLIINPTDSTETELNLSPYISIFADRDGSFSLEKVIDSSFVSHFSPFSDSLSKVESDVSWLKFKIYNRSSQPNNYKISIIFTDYILLYVPDGKGGFTEKQTGDLVWINKREVSVGQMVFANIPVYGGQSNTYYIRLARKSDISRQFQKLALRSVMLYSENRFKKIFIDSRIYQSAFYGAILVILFYNIVLLISLRNLFSFYYVLFTTALVLFLASNNGFLAETVFKENPRLDLYLRFISTPSFLFFYTLFSKSYLKLKYYLPKINILINYWMGFLVLVIILMISGFWSLGRTLVVFSGIANFLVIAVVAVISLRKGFTPARYFLAANTLFLLSGTLFALQRINFVVYDPLNQYQTQISAVLQVALFSLGLSERIQLVRKELIEKTLENERLERQKEQELKKVTEEKNLAMQKVVEELDMFIYKTAHDIRGPLARLLGLSQVAKIDVNDALAISYFDKLNYEAENLSNILARLSKVHEIKYVSIKKEKITPAILLKKIIADECEKVESEKIEIEMEVDENLVFVSDVQLIEIVLRNLIENAIRFRRKQYENKQFINISVSRINNKLIVIKIIDNGIGIDPQYRSIIFDMFSRAAGIHKTAGLGLYISKLSAEKLGGSIKLINNSSGFTEFAVEIPT